MVVHKKQKKQSQVTGWKFRVASELQADESVGKWILGLDIFNIIESSIDAAWYRQKLQTCSIQKWIMQ